MNTRISEHVGNRKHRIRMTGRTAVATMVALAVGLSQAPLASADTTSSAQNTVLTSSTGVATMGRGETYIPLVDTEAGKWPQGMDTSSATFLTSGADVAVPLELADSGTPAETDPQDALVRVTVLSAPQSPQSEPTEVLAGGDAFLSVPAGESRSTMVLLPVQNKAVALHTTTDTGLRIETIATFNSNVSTPGGLHSVTTPVIRADTAVGSGTTPRLGAVAGETASGALGATAPAESGAGGSVTFGVTGQGGVPSTDVRSVSLSIRLQSTAAQTVTVGGQRMQVEAGEEVLNVFADPDAQGNVSVQTEQPTAIRAVVRGWVDDAAQNSKTQNAGQGIVSLGAKATDSSTPGDGQPREYQVKAGEPQTIDFSGAPSDAAYALVQADITKVSERSQIEIGEFYLGRGRGLAVQPGRTESELMLVPVVGGQVTVREGEADVTLTVRQYVLQDSSDTEGGSEDNDRMVITSPDNGATEHLEHSATFTMDGIYTRGDSSLDRIEIFAQKASGSAPSLVGTAEVSPDADSPDSLAWAAEVSAPETGEYIFSAVAKDTDGTIATQQITVHVVLQDDESQPMVSNDAWLLRSGTFVKAEDALAAPATNGGSTGNSLLEASPEQSSLAVSEVQTDSVLLVDQPPFAPGDVLITGSLSADSAGMLRHVVSIDHRSDGWRVLTSDATLTDVFQQLDIAETTNTADQVNPDDVKAESTAQPVAGSDPVTIEQPMSGAAAQPVQVSPAVDVSPGSESAGVTDCSVVEAVDDSGSSEGALQSAPSCDPQQGLSSANESDALGVKAEAGFTTNVQMVWDTSKDPFGEDVLSQNVKDISQLAPKERSSREAEIKASGGASLGLSGALTLGVDVAAKVGIRWKWVPRPYIKDLHIIIENDVKAQVAFKAWIKVKAEASAEYKLVQVPIMPITVMAGPIPIVFKPYANIGVAASLSLSGSTEAQFAISSKSKYGFEYSDGKLKRVAVTEKSGDQFTPTDEVTGKVAKTVTVDASIGPSLEAGVLLYGAVGLQASLEAGAGATATVRQEEGVDGEGKAYNRLKYSAEVYLAAGAKGSAEIRIPVIDFKLKSFLLVEISGRMNIWSGEGEKDLLPV